MEFTAREEQLLIYAIAGALASTQHSINFYTVHSDMENAETERKIFKELIELYLRFLPHSSDEDILRVIADL